MAIGNLHKARHLIENFFAKLKLFRCIATYYDKFSKKLLCTHPPRGYHHLAQLDDTTL
jgi:transposase